MSPVGKNKNQRWIFTFLRQTNSHGTLFRRSLQFTIVYPSDVTCSLQEHDIIDSLSYQFGKPDVHIILEDFQVVIDNELNFHVNISIEIVGGASDVQFVFTRAKQLADGGNLTLYCRKVDVLSTSDPNSLTKSVETIELYLIIDGAVLLGFLLIFMIVLCICLRIISIRYRDVKNELTTLRKKQVGEVSKLKVI